MNRRKRVRPSRGVSCMKIIKWLDLHFEEFFMVVFLVLITVVSLMQVIVRNIEVIPSLTWAEEFCRFCWIGSVFLSLPYTIRNISMLRVCVLLDLLPETVHKLINIATYFITAACRPFWPTTRWMWCPTSWRAERSPPPCSGPCGRYTAPCSSALPGDRPRNPAGNPPHYALQPEGADHPGTDDAGRGPGGRAGKRMEGGAD